MNVCRYCGHEHEPTRPKDWPNVFPRYDICWDAHEGQERINDQVHEMMLAQNPPKAKA